MERFSGSSLTCLKGSHYGLHLGSMKDMQEHWAIFGSGQRSLQLHLEGGIAGDRASI